MPTYYFHPKILPNQCHVDITTWFWNKVAHSGGFGTVLNNLPANARDWVQSPGQEDPLEKGTATHSSILAWRIRWTKKPGQLQSMGLQGIRHD